MTELSRIQLNRLGSRLALHGDNLYMLGNTYMDPYSGQSRSALDVVNLPMGQVSEHTIFQGVYRPRATSMAFSTDGSRFYVTGWNRCCSTFVEADFLSGTTAEEWSISPYAHNTTIYFADGRRVELLPGVQRQMDANGNYVEIHEPSGYQGDFTLTYNDTMGRNLAKSGSLGVEIHQESILPWRAPSPAWDADGIPYTPPNTIPVYKERNYPGYEAPFKFGYLPLSNCPRPGEDNPQDIYLSSRATDVILDPAVFPCAAQAGALFGGYARYQQVENVNCFNPLMLTEIQLPNDQLYKFYYNRYGEMSRITYPTGGYERFEYAQVPLVGSFQQRLNVWANRGVWKRFVSATGNAADECVYVYETLPDEPVIGDGTPDAPEYYRVIRRVKFYADADTHELPGAVPDAQEDHYFYRADSRNYWFVAYGLEPVLSGKEYETREYLKTGGNLHLHQRTLREYTAGLFNPQQYLVTISGKKVGWRNPLVTAEMTFLYDGGENPQRTAMVKYEYDRSPQADSYFQFCRLLHKRSYDYVSGGDAPRPSMNRNSAWPAGSRNTSDWPSLCGWRTRSTPT